MSKQLRCLVCQNQSIDDSDADLARDLRVEVRRQLSTGSSDAEILANLRDTYGDYVLLNPPVSPGTYVLWGSPVFILLAGAAIIMAGRRRREDAGGTVTEDRRHRRQCPCRPEQDARPSPLAASSWPSASVSISCWGGPTFPASRLPDAAPNWPRPRMPATRKRPNGRRISTSAIGAAASPEDVGAWLRLAMAAAAAGETNTELAALEQAEQLTKGDPAIRAMRAEAMSRAADGQVTIPARELIADILTEDPSEPRALFLSGLAAIRTRISERPSRSASPPVPVSARRAMDGASCRQYCRCGKAGGIDLDAVTAARGPMPRPWPPLPRCPTRTAPR